MRGTTPSLRVEAYRNLASLRPFAGELHSINLAAQRPSPFHTLEYFEIFLAHDEYRVDGAQPLLLVAFEGERPIALLPLSRRPAFRLPQLGTKLELLTTHDSERPYFVVRPADEERCAEAFMQHLFEHDRGWDFLELVEQDPSSALARAATERGRSSFHVRRFPNNPNATIPLATGYDVWMAGLSSQLRGQLRNRLRALLSEGTLELIVTEDPVAARALLPRYVELESRSWKLEARAGISRHPDRIKLFDAMLSRGQAATPVVHFLLLDALPVAGMISLRFGPVVYQMEIVFDDTFKRLSPGNALLVLGVRDVCARGATTFNMLGNFAYHKGRMGAQITETAAVQVYRRLRPAWLKAQLGELKRRVMGAPIFQRDASRNLSKPAAPVQVSAGAQAAARAKMAEVLAELSQKGVAFERQSGDALAAALKKAPAESAERSAQGPSRGAAVDGF